MAAQLLWANLSGASDVGAMCAAFCGDDVGKATSVGAVLPIPEALNGSSLVDLDTMTLDSPLSTAAGGFSPSAAEIWGYGMISVTLINLCAVAGIAFFPLLHNRLYHQALTYLVGLGVGSLSGSALFHLLPQAFGVVPGLEGGVGGGANSSSAGTTGSAASGDTFDPHDYLYKSCMAASGVYLFFCFDRIIKLYSTRRQSSKRQPSGEERTDVGNTTFTTSAGDETGSGGKILWEMGPSVDSASDPAANEPRSHRDSEGRADIGRFGATDGPKEEQSYHLHAATSPDCRCGRGTTGKDRIRLDSDAFYSDDGLERDLGGDPIVASTGNHSLATPNTETTNLTFPLPSPSPPSDMCQRCDTYHRKVVDFIAARDAAGVPGFNPDDETVFDQDAEKLVESVRSCPCGGMEAARMALASQNTVGRMNRRAKKRSVRISESSFVDHHQKHSQQGTENALQMVDPYLSKLSLTSAAMAAALDLDQPMRSTGGSTSAIGGSSYRIASGSAPYGDSFLPPVSVCGHQHHETSCVALVETGSSTGGVDSLSGQSAIKTVAWMIIFGDGLHNFIDGLSIGAAFSTRIMSGISVSLAVLCEEFPHELGDVAILLRSGLSLRQALVYNLLSAATCYLGFMLGVLVGEMAEASIYIFGLAGGMFLYISLANMVPEMNSQMDLALSTSVRSALTIFALQFGGILTGLLLMFVMSYWGGSIQIE